MTPCAFTYFPKRRVSWTQIRPGVHQQRALGHHPSDLQHPLVQRVFAGTDDADQDPQHPLSLSGVSVPH